MKNENVVAFTGGGTGGHIYPGLAVADLLGKKFAARGQSVRIVWLGSLGKMDRKIVQNARSFSGCEGRFSAEEKSGEMFSGKNLGERNSNEKKSPERNSYSAGGNSKNIIDAFYGIPSGKLRRYFSIKNFIDIFKIGFGFFAAFFILLKERPAFLFSKGGFVSVPPCFAARILGIKVYTHECDFTPGLATRINARFANEIFLSYEETKKYFSPEAQRKLVVTGNPVREVFYDADPEIGRKFIFTSALENPESENYLEEKVNELGEGKPARLENEESARLENEKPVLLVTGGSLGAAQINELVAENLEWLCENFVVVHQTGQKNETGISQNASAAVKKNYHPFAFIYGEMPHVFALADVALSRSGANSIWEAAVLAKPMVLLPLEGEGTRGDQVDNAEFFARQGAAIVIRKSDASSQKLRDALSRLLQKNVREEFSSACRKITGSEKPVEKIAGILFAENFDGGKQ